MKCKQIVNKCWDRCARLWDECCGVYYNKEESGKGKKECIGMGGFLIFEKMVYPMVEILFLGVGCEILGRMLG